MPDRDTDDDDYRPTPTPRGQDREIIALLKERQRTLTSRVDSIETRLNARIDADEVRLTAMEQKQRDLDALLNKGFGAIAFITAAGVFIGWLISIGGNVFRFFK